MTRSIPTSPSPVDYLSNLPRCSCGCLIGQHTVTGGPVKTRGGCEVHPECRAFRRPGDPEPEEPAARAT